MRPGSSPTSWSTSWLRPHRGSSQKYPGHYLAFFEFIHNARKRGEVVLHALVEVLLTGPHYALWGCPNIALGGYAHRRTDRLRTRVGSPSVLRAFLAADSSSM